jgi:DNA-binding SARP family transcriptional activator/class 3 adenylate cyclase
VAQSKRAARTGPQTLLFTDIEGSTRLARKLGDRFDEILDAHHRIVRTTLSAPGGREIDAAGDGFFFAFARAQDAVRGAVEAQRALGSHPWPDDVVVKVRIGIHTGDTRVSGDRHRGVAVHRAARIASAAQGGQILLSQATHSFLDDDEAAVADLGFIDLGEHLIKDFDRPVRLYQVLAEGLDADFAPPSNGEHAAPADQALTIRLLGPLDVERGAVPVAIAGQKQRAVLALLALRAGEVVPTEVLIDRLWGESPPRTAPTSLQNAISHLRKALGGEAVVTRPRGYALALDREQVDAHRFEALLETAAGADAETRVGILREALQLWRGPPLADFTYDAFAQGEIARLEDRRLAAREERLDAELELGRSADLVGELESLVEENPLRERLRGQLMLALYRSGRQAEALQAYQEARRTLVDELGIEPSPSLQQLHASILRQESSLHPAAMPEAGQDRLGDVVRALLSGRLVPVLGPSPPAQNGNEVHARLAKAFDCPEEHRGDLSRVSQYVAVTHGVGPLYDELHELFAAETEPGPVERFLARFPAAARASGVDHPLVVTTGYGLGLELAFEQAGEEIDVVSYVAIGRDRGKFVHRRPDGSEAVISVPNTYADLSLADRPVVLKIHGEVDIRADRGRESFVVSEDDYIGYLAQTELANVVPVTLAAKLRRSHLLFFAYPVVEWSLRVFLHRVFGDEAISYRSWAVLPGAQPIQREFWRHRGVDLYDVSLETFVDDLERRLADAVPA